MSSYIFGFCHPPSPWGPHPPSGPAPVGAGLPAVSLPVLAQPEIVVNVRATTKHISNILFMALFMTLSFTVNDDVCFVPPLRCYGSNAKMRFQSFFMLMTVQPCFFASSCSLIPQTQFSSFSPGTLSNSRRLLLTSGTPSASACAAIQRSLLPMGVPALCSAALTSP